MSHPRMDFKSLPPNLRSKLKENSESGVRFIPSNYKYFLNKHRMGEASDMIQRIQREKAIDDPTMHKFVDPDFEIDEQ